MATVSQSTLRRQYFNAKASSEEQEVLVNFDPEPVEKKASSQRTQRRLLQLARFAARRYMPKGSLDDLENEDLEEGESAGHYAARFAVNRYKSKLFKKYVADVVKKALTRAVLNKVKIAFGVTLIGAIISYLIMLFQYIGGNLMHSKLIPSLGIKERYLFYIVSCILISLVLIALTLLIVVARIMLIDIKFIVKLLWDGLTGLIGL